jgi:hypothetical protein
VPAIPDDDRVVAVFTAVVDLVGKQRDARLVELCGGAAGLRQAVDDLLRLRSPFGTRAPATLWARWRASTARRSCSAPTARCSRQWGKSTAEAADVVGLLLATAKAEWALAQALLTQHVRGRQA